MSAREWKRLLGQGLIALGIFFLLWAVLTIVL